MSMISRLVPTCFASGAWGLVAMATMMLGVGCGAPAQNVESAKPTARIAKEAPDSDDDDDRPRVKRRGKTIEDAIPLCMSDEDGEPRSDYSFIAEYECPDGSMPLEGKIMRGAAARVGNVGAGPDGHIIDLYEIPCPTGRVRVFVDGYHCKSDEANKVDPNHLTKKQLMAIARGVRERHDDPSSRSSMKFRQFFITWLTKSPQVNIVLCDIGEFLPDKPEYIGEYAISLGAAVIEDGHFPVADPIHTHLAAFAGVAKFYQAVLREEGPSARDAKMDKLVQMLTNGELKKRLPTVLKGCKTNEMGIRN